MKGKMLRLLLPLLFVSSLVFAGTTGKIAGVVTDGRTGEPLPSVNVVVEGTRMGASTNVEGYFVILNVPPGRYRVVASLVGYKNATVANVRVDIDQTTQVNIGMGEEAIAGEEVTVIATRPVVQKDVAQSRLNIEAQDVQKLPVSSVASAVTLQAGIQGGLVIRGGGADQTAWIVDGAIQREARGNTPNTLISFASVQDIQVQTGGFTAEYGDLRSGVVGIVTREGDRAKYSFSMQGRYAPAQAKHFGPTIYDASSYWIRPYLDDAVAWTGTTNGQWDPWTQRQFPQFEGWNAVSQKLLADGDPNNDLSPEAAQQVFLWEHRKVAENRHDDWDADIGIGGPVPFAEDLGNLRFFYSYRKELESYLIPLASPWYEGHINTVRLTTDVMGGMKLSAGAKWGKQEGTGSSRAGDTGLFRSAASVARGAGRATGSYVDARIFSTNYFNTSVVNSNTQDIKLSHALSSDTYYEVLLQRSEDRWDTNPPGTLRDTSRAVRFGNNYLVDVAPFGYFPTSYYNSTGITGLRTAVGFANSRDTSRATTYRIKADITSQLDKYNQIRGGVEFRYTDLRLRYGNDDLFLRATLTTTDVTAFPIYFAAYVQDKLEFELMVATLGLRLDYLAPNGDWYDIEDDKYNSFFAGGSTAPLDEVIPKSPVDPQLMLSPRLNISFPVTDYAKLFFNYGHFRQIPSPINLFRLRRYTDSGRLDDLGDPRAPVPRTIAYEIGYEHSFLEEYLLRVSGYYKDETNYPLYISYVDPVSGVDYTQYTNRAYADKRGFELSVYKNRGNWIQGFINYTYEVTSSGQFGYSFAYSDPSEQRTEEEANPTQPYQTKPVPQPYARLNLDFLSPSQVGDGLTDILFADWRINLLAGWRAGPYFTWAGGGSIPGLVNNVQWKDTWFADLRIEKSFAIGPVNLMLFADIYNLFDIKQMGYSSGIFTYGFVDGNDYLDYMRSLHLKDFPPKGFEQQIGYINIPGDDRPGEWRDFDVDYQPIVAVQTYSALAEAVNQQSRPFYYVADEGQYYQLVGGTWQQVEQGRVDKVLDDKAYIDMPNMESWWFLDPRRIYWGIRLSFDL